MRSSANVEHDTRPVAVTTLILVDPALRRRLDICIERWNRLHGTLDHTRLHQLVHQQNLVAAVVVRIATVVLRNAFPGVTASGRHTLEMPGGHVGANTGIKQVVWAYAVFGKLLQVNRVDLADANVHRAVGVSADRSRLKRRLDPQDGSEDIGIDRLVLRRLQDAPLARRGEGRFFALRVHVHAKTSQQEGQCKQCA